ncbi:glycosyltransferase [Herbiconiux sp. P18]|uniref:glycosyltransferase n=1 Tax=Herbiconiux liangxiaofengii TaxID=3342795 RepID=UPI0035B6D90C
MRIAILCHLHHPIAEPFQGGTESHTALLADELVRRGHDVTLFAKEGSRTAATVHPLVPSDFEFAFAASPLVRQQQQGFLAEASLHSIELIEQGGFDAVINNSLSSLPYRRLRELPMMTVLHTPPTLTDVNAILDAPGWSPSPLHSYVTVSETNARAWLPRLPQVVSVPNGIPLERWAVDGAREPGVAVWAARITPEKGLHIAISAARAAGFRLRIAGPIADPRYFADEIEPQLAAGDVEYVGHLGHDELPAFYAAAQVFVASPVWEEPFGLSVVEALASGTPVATLPNGAVPELVSAASGPAPGAVAADDSATALAVAIREASLITPEAARARAARYSLERMIDAYEDELLRLVERASVALGVGEPDARGERAGHAADAPVLVDAVGRGERRLIPVGGRDGRGVAGGLLRRRRRAEPALVEGERQHRSTLADLLQHQGGAGEEDLVGDIHSAQPRGELA